MGCGACGLSTQFIKLPSCLNLPSAEHDQAPGVVLSRDQLLGIWKTRNPKPEARVLEKLGTELPSPVSIKARRDAGNGCLLLTDGPEQQTGVVCIW